MIEKEPAISDFLATRIADGDFPSAVYVVGQDDEPVFGDALGNAVVEPHVHAATPDTIYDLASLTKVVVTTLLIVRLLRETNISPDEPLAKFFPAFGTSDKSVVTIRHLLTHTSGFAAWKPFYLLTSAPDDVPECIAALPLAEPIDAKVIYSDLNFIMLGKLIEHLTGQPLDVVFHEVIAKPLGLRHACFNPSPTLKVRIAASEKGNVFELNTCLETGFSKDEINGKLRRELVWGDVHDGNCFYLQGVSGHAGLFADAADAYQLARQFLPDQTAILNPSDCEVFRTNFTPHLNEARSFGFQLAATPESTASKSLASDSFGHLGFSGTSLWIEPETARVFILLTNRTHARELPFVNINSVRRRFHELATDAFRRR